MEEAHNTNNWSINLVNERLICNKYLIDLFIIITDICKNFVRGHINLRYNESLVNS